MNKVILLGRLTKDPEIRYTQSSEPLCTARFTVAVNKRFKKDGEPDADFIGCSAVGRTAEFVERFIKKGMQVSLCGRISVRSYDDNTGQKRWITEVNAEEVNFAESREAFEARAAKGGSDYSSASMPPSGSGREPEGFSAITQSIDEDDDLPF